MNFFPCPGTTGVQSAALAAAGSPGSARLHKSAGSGGQGGAAARRALPWLIPAQPVGAWCCVWWQAWAQEMWLDCGWGNSGSEQNL